MLRCTHLVFYAKDVAVTRDFYIYTLGCVERRYAPDEGFLSVAAGEFILNFYGFAPDQTLPDGYNRGVAHLGLELPTRRDVEEFFRRLEGCTRFGSGQRALWSVTELAASQTPGPYRFYVRDSDGYLLELHTWKGVEG